MAKKRTKSDSAPKEKKPWTVTLYSDEDRVQALALYRLYGSHTKVSEELGIPRTTIFDWVNNRKGVLDSIDSLPERVDDAAKRHYANMQFVMSEALAQVHKRIGDASAAQAATIYGILHDKCQDIIGNQANQTTNNIYIDTSGMSDQDKLVLMQRALDRKREAESIEAAAVVDDAGDLE